MAEGALYAIGGFDPENGNLTEDQVLLELKDVFQFNAEKNKWVKLPSMIKPHDMEAGHMLYHNGFIYVLGGAHYDDNRNDVERFCIAEQKWERLASLPSPFYFGPGIVYQDRILVYGAAEEVTEGYNHKLLEYNPTSNTWETLLAEEFNCYYDDDISEWTFCPVIFEHNGQFYRVLYTPKENFNPLKRQLYQVMGRRILNHNLLTKPKVNKLVFESTNNVSIGEEVGQECIPENVLGAFRINEEVFVNINGFVHKTDVTVGVDQETDVDLRIWSKFRAQKFEDSNYVSYYVDKKKVQGF